MNEIEQKIDRLTLAVLLLAKMVAKLNKIKLTKNEKLAFSQIAPNGGSLSVFADMINGNE